jgi:hypothetical protein
VVLAMAMRWHVASYAGGVLLATTLALFATGLRAMQRRSLQRPAWGIRWYYACVIFLVAGGALGLQLARGAPLGHGDLLSAHVTLTVLGWLGTAIVGSLHTFFPTLSGRRLARPQLEGPTFACWTLGVSLLAAGYVLALGPLAALGLLGLSAGALCWRTCCALRARRGARSGWRPVSCSAVSCAWGPGCRLPRASRRSIRHSGSVAASAARLRRCCSRAGSA